jgi:hypothetical protein
MPSLISYWICDVCRNKHDTQEAAAACEAKGLPPIIPPGLVYGDSEGFYNEIVFVVGRGEPKIWGGHYGSYGVWCFRDTHIGDSIGKIQCGQDYHEIRTSIEKGRLDKEMPAYSRAIAYLEEKGIKPYFEIP